MPIPYASTFAGGAVPEDANSEPEEMKHDDVMGELVPEEEAAEARNIILQLVGPHALAM